MTGRTSRIAAAAALIVGLGVASASASLANPGPSQVSVVHGIPGATVDVYVNGGLTLEAFAPATVQGPLTLEPGVYNIEVYLAQTDPPDKATDRADAPVIDEDETVPADANVSLVANIATGSPTITPFVNDTKPTQRGQGRVTVRHTAAAGPVDIYVNGQPALTNLAPLTQQAAELPAGTYDVSVRAPGGTPTVLDVPGVVVTAGVNLIVYAIGDPDPAPVEDGADSAAATVGTFTVVTQSITVGEEQPATTTTTTAPTTTAPTTTAPAAVAGTTAAPSAAAVAAAPAFAG